jgi:hypothetical protein
MYRDTETLNFELAGENYYARINSESDEPTYPKWEEPLPAAEQAEIEAQEIELETGCTRQEIAFTQPQSTGQALSPDKGWNETVDGSGRTRRASGGRGASWRRRWPRSTPGPWRSAAISTYPRIRSQRVCANGHEGGGVA